MTVASPVKTSSSQDLFVEFRCSRCYQIRHESTDRIGIEVECPYCRAEQSVPHMPVDQLKTLETVLEARRQITVEHGQFDHQPLSEEQIEEISKARAEERASTANPSGPFGHYADLSTRVTAFIIDQVLACIAVVASYCVGDFLSSIGLCMSISEIRAPNYDVPATTLIAYGAVLYTFCIVVWFMIAKFGQSPGKLLCGIKIVDDYGKPPGFFRGVVLRIWSAKLITTIVPLAFTINYGLAFYAKPPLCGHDHLAGTHVVCM